MNIKHILSHLFGLLSLFIIGALPLAFSNTAGNVTFNLWRIPEKIYQFILGLLDGSSFQYLEFDRERFFFQEAGTYFITSYVYLITAGFFVLIFAIIFGIWLWRKTDKGLNSYLGFIGMIPDFVFVLLLQVLVIYIYQKTGFKIARVASFSMDKPAVLLPLIVLFVLPFFYLLKNLIEHTFDVATESYIRTARAKGLNKRQVYLYHVTTNVIPFLKADLYKVTSIMIGNLFIVEYLFNLKGLTSMLFPMNNGYQYNLFILCFIAFFIMYVTLLFFLKLIIYLLERVLSHEQAI